jgi:hypothetical protein
MNSKKLIAGFSCGAMMIGAALVLPFSTFAQTTHITVTGHNYPNGQDVHGIPVNVICFRAGEEPVYIYNQYGTPMLSNPEYVYTDANGLYVKQFSEGQCEMGDTVRVQLGDTGNIHKVTVESTTVVVDLNSPIATVPEFGLLTGGLAALTSTGAFFGLRKRKILG